ncbi:MAG: flagellar basal body P-ring formation chaperone FlgA [Bacteroidetes bacterium]|nr:flagellar basal body P-ring formation chaperone FlgA [Rhodothermia bacterium]MCS7156069.1 flagellar basal body P-ring formation chaperone FlgA [Bacteroidota bacterium]MCX7907757.1 flagellar basal body P-ring formation chaperone FlgA [Bacteroidota bacterium]MDW8137886.1 flagellar basal body P-ring formation chaperone FlgA [Bacteroidota bacterium]MDW8286263.1 flagellar basal body P-ring formation chaperone FlgA [Bacteroidota bacterium]
MMWGTLLWLVGASLGNPGAEEVLRCVLEALSRRFPDRTAHWQVQLRRIPSWPEGKPFRIEYAEAQPPRGLTLCWMLEPQGALRRPVVVYVAEFDTVWVVSRPMEAGEPLRTDALSPRWMEVTALEGAYVRHPEQWQDAQTRRRLSVGTILLSHHLERRPVVRSGQPVTLLIRQRGLEISIPAVARGTGPPGTVIRVYAPDTRRMYEAQIVAEGIVLWKRTL